MSDTVHKLVQTQTLARMSVSFPENLGKRLNKFLLDTLTGNVQVHIRDGKILGMTIEEKLSLRP